MRQDDGRPAGSARERFLARLRPPASGAVPAPAAGETAGPSLTWDDFRAALAEADGLLHAPVARADLPAALAVLAAAAGGESAYAHGAAALLGKNPAASEPRALDGLPCLVATGRLAVARTGSILVTEREVPVRAHLLLPETLVLLVSAGALVDDLPDAYAALDPARLAGGYVTLVSGPSRTADIEQTLVTGAHGPRRLTVVPLADVQEA